MNVSGKVVLCLLLMMGTAAQAALPDVQALRASAASGDSKAMLALGEALEYGWGTKMDQKEAFHWYQRSAEAGNTTAMKNVGNFYRTGRGGVAADAKQAADWYRKCADAGDPKGMVNFGQMLMYGQGVTQDQAQAVALFRKALDSGELIAAEALGLAHEAGRGVVADPAEAQRLFRQAEAEYLKRAQADDADMMLRLSALYFRIPRLSRNPGDAATWARKAAELGRTDAMRVLAHYYRSGTGGVAKDEAAAFTWELKAAEKGDPAAMATVASMYEKGTGVTQNAQAAEMWRQKAKR